MSENLLNAYTSMFLLRRAEEKIAEYYLNNKIFSFVHFYVGQEAVAVGVCENLTTSDRVFGNHRSHGHYLAKGGNLGEMYAEMLGKATGCCKGKGGSMHMLDRSVNFMGSTPILASAVPIAAGSALQQKMTGSNNISAVFIGDGGAEEGIMYETMNFASLFNLPLLIILENNLYSVNSLNTARKSEKFSYKDLCKGFDVNYLKANGNDFFDVTEKAAQAVRIIKETGKPAILECIVFRHMAHSAPLRDDKIGYRQIDTDEVRKEKDSVLNLRKYMIEKLGKEAVEGVELTQEILITNALEFALNSPMPELDELYKGVFH